MSILTLKDFTFNEAGDEFLKITGRPTGFSSWIKSLFGKDSITTFTCNKREAKLESDGMKYNVPLRHVTCVGTGMSRPKLFLILGIVFAIAGFVIYFSLDQWDRNAVIIIFGLILGAVFIILYALNKTMQFSIFTGPNIPIISMRVKGSIDFDRVVLASNALNKTVLEAK